MENTCDPQHRLLQFDFLLYVCPSTPGAKWEKWLFLLLPNIVHSITPGQLIYRVLMLQSRVWEQMSLLLKWADGPERNPFLKTNPTSSDQGGIGILFCLFVCFNPKGTCPWALIHRTEDKQHSGHRSPPQFDDSIGRSHGARWKGKEKMASSFLWLAERSEESGKLELMRTEKRNEIRS